MIFIINSQGTPQSVLYEPINQGSNGANQIILVAPFAQSVNPTVAFTLPNGIQTQEFLMTPFQNNTGEILYDADKNAYNMWSVDIDYPITEYAGTVDVQFALYLGVATAEKPNGKVLRTPSTSFEVGEGVTVELPKEPSPDIYDQILDYLSSISDKSQTAISKSIDYIRYLAPEEYLLNDKVLSLSAFPLNTINGLSRFTVDGMTSELAPENLKNPNNIGAFFFKTDKENGANTGFVLDFYTPNKVSIVQLYVYNYTTDISISCYYENQNTQTWEFAESVSLPPLADPNTIEIVQLHIPDYTTKIKIVQESGASPCTYKGVELWQANEKGQFEIVRNNGVISYIDTYDAETFVAQLTNLKNLALASEDTARWWATGEPSQTHPEENPNSAKSYADKSEKSLSQMLSKAGKAGGYPILQEINGEAKIPTVYIQQVDIHSHIEITDEAQLDTIDAQEGDVAILVSTIDGEKTIVKSWLLIGTTDGVRNWAVYGASYAVNAGTANYAKSAGNANKINELTINKLSQSSFNNLSNKDGIYFVTIGE